MTGSALVLFAGKAYLQMPLTTDHGAARCLFPLPVPMQCRNREL